MGASLEIGAALATEATSTTRPDNFTFDKYSLGLKAVAEVSTRTAEDKE